MLTQAKELVGELDSGATGLRIATIRRYTSAAGQDEFTYKLARRLAGTGVTATACTPEGADAWTP